MAGDIFLNAYQRQELHERNELERKLLVLLRDVQLNDQAKKNWAGLVALLQICKKERLRNSTTNPTSIASHTVKPD